MCAGSTSSTDREAASAPSKKPARERARARRYRYSRFSGIERRSFLRSGERVVRLACSVEGYRQPVMGLRPVRRHPRHATEPGQPLLGLPLVEREEPEVDVREHVVGAHLDRSLEVLPDPRIRAVRQAHRIVHVRQCLSAMLHAVRPETRLGSIDPIHRERRDRQHEHGDRGRHRRDPWSQEPHCEHADHEVQEPARRERAIVDGEMADRDHRGLGHHERPVRQDSEGRDRGRAPDPDCNGETGHDDHQTQQHPGVEEGRPLDRQRRHANRLGPNEVLQVLAQMDVRLGQRVRPGPWGAGLDAREATEVEK